MSTLERELIQINGRINRWRAFEVGLWGFAALLLGWTLLALVDVWLRPQGWLRHGLSAVLIVLGIGAVIGIARILSKRRNPASVAAFLESRFPQLDNHLINRVLFATDSAQSSPWLKDYMHDSVPGWSVLPLAEIKNRKVRRNGALAVLGIVAVMAVLGAVMGEAWKVALTRVFDPTSKKLPPTFAALMSVEPGHGKAIQGDAVEITVTAKGRAGQEVILEVPQEESTKTTMVLWI